VGTCIYTLLQDFIYIPNRFDWAFKFSLIRRTFAYCLGLHYYNLLLDKLAMFNIYIILLALNVAVSKVKHLLNDSTLLLTVVT